MKAVIFDFDRTLCPTSQLHPILNAWGLDPEEFFNECNELQQGMDGFDQEHSYLYRLVKEGREEISRRLDDSRMRVWGRAVELYPGMRPSKDDPGLFRRIKATGANIFIVSGGLQPIIEGCLFRHGLHRVVSKVFACRMAEEDPGDGYGARLSFPKEVVNFTVKTQKLFAIKKGLWLPERQGLHVNDRMMAKVNFNNMLYVGDGWNDVAAFATVNKFGGTSIAVCGDSERVEEAEKLKAYGRVKDWYLPDYRKGMAISTAIETWCEHGVLKESEVEFF